MTRGTFYYIKAGGKVTETRQFNGDMGYKMQNYESALHIIQSENVADFIERVFEFNIKTFKYESGEMLYSFPEMFDSKNFIDFSHDNGYFDRFNSDYLYIRNGSNEKIKMRYDDEYFSLEPDQYCVLNFGRLVLRTY